MCREVLKDQLNQRRAPQVRAGRSLHTDAKSEEKIFDEQYDQSCTGHLLYIQAQASFTEKTKTVPKYNHERARNDDWIMDHLVLPQFEVLTIK